MRYRWVRAGEASSHAHYAADGASLTMCGGFSVGPDWEGEPRATSREQPGERCGDCIYNKLAATGEIRVRTRSRFVPIAR